ncbi:MAG: dephospho-CoA kinase [Woeseiaceae bacterium]|nr:dephospho-CoA kinase [Woeseiaceae bacterium]
MSDARTQPLRIGLTGGIASGKSTVADMFAAHGVPIIDTDLIAREVVQPGQPALDDIRHEFGDDVIAEDGSLDRAEMRRIVFSDEDARKRLEAITHPRIGEATRAQAARAGGDYQIIVVPLLVTSALRDHVDRVLVVDCDEDTQIRRLIERDSEAEGQARRMLAAQATREERLAIADDVISNMESVEQTQGQVDKLHRIYLRLSQNGD